MEINDFVTECFNDLCVDERITNGIFDITNSDHQQIFKEYVSNRFGDDFASELYNNIRSVTIDEGNFPERQAYNENGILVTFPDPESKKAAIERGSHFENPPAGTQKSDSESSDTKTDDVDTSNGESEEEEKTSVFTNMETPEQEVEREKAEMELSPAGTDLSPSDVKFRDSGDSKESSKERHRLYDILKSIKTSRDDDDVDAVQGEDGESFQLDDLHPSVLFALSEKWVFDKSGDWYDEFGKYKGDTDLRGQVHPSKWQDKEKMFIWIEDYEKRAAGIQVPDDMTD